MRIIDNEHFRHQIMVSIDIVKRLSQYNSRLHCFNQAHYLDGVMDGLIKALELLEQEKHISTIIGDNNIYRLSIKEREHRVQQKH